MGRPRRRLRWTSLVVLCMFGGHSLVYQLMIYHNVLFHPNRPDPRVGNAVSVHSGFHLSMGIEAPQECSAVAYPFNVVVIRDSGRLGGFIDCRLISTSHHHHAGVQQLDGLGILNQPVVPPAIDPWVEALCPAGRLVDDPPCSGGLPPLAGPLRLRRSDLRVVRLEVRHPAVGVIGRAGRPLAASTCSPRERTMRLPFEGWWGPCAGPRIPRTATCDRSGKPARACL